jgi:magnesium chelatase family protein
MLEATSKPRRSSVLLLSLPVRLLWGSEAGLHLYRKRISGPLLDRIDIHIEVPRVEYERLADDRLGETSAAIWARVQAERERSGRSGPMQ